MVVIIQICQRETKKSFLLDEKVRDLDLIKKVKNHILRLLKFPIGTDICLYTIFKF